MATPKAQCTGCQKLFSANEFVSHVQDGKCERAQSKYHICYDGRVCPTVTMDKETREFYSKIASTREPARCRIAEYVIPPRSGLAWEVRKGQVCRISVMNKPQVLDFNVWNLHNPRERMWAAKTRQLHASHVTTGDRLWSTFPYVRPMLTITGDSVAYGIDEDGAGCHDLLGSRCDPYTDNVLSGNQTDSCCHSNLVRAVAPYHLSEFDVHDVLNIFMITGITKDTHQYFVKGSPAKAGDFFEFISEIDLLCAGSTCPQGDISIPAWGPEARDMTQVCDSLRVEVYDISKDVLGDRPEPKPSQYRGVHGMSRPPQEKEFV